MSYERLSYRGIDVQLPLLPRLPLWARKPHEGCIKGPVQYGVPICSFNNRLAGGLVNRLYTFNPSAEEYDPDPWDLQGSEVAASLLNLVAEIINQIWSQLLETSKLWGYFYVEVAWKEERITSFINLVFLPFIPQQKTAGYQTFEKLWLFLSTHNPI